MSPEDLLNLANEKQTNAKIIAGSAETHPDESEKAALLNQSTKLLAEAARLRKKASVGDGVLSLNPTLPQAEIENARKSQSIRIDQDFFLPLFRSDCVPLPYIFVRSNLFPGSLTPEPTEPNKLNLLNSWSKEQSISTKGHSTQLCSFDRSVFAACLLHFKNRPLNSQDDDDTVSTTIRRLSENLEISYGSGVADRIKASLTRLSHTGIIVENKTTQIELKSLISIENSTCSTNEIKLKIPERLSILYKKNQWWSVPLSAIIKPGLAGWLGCYYSSHREWQQVKLEKIRLLSGLSLSGYRFKVKLEKALISLQDKTVDEAARIKSYDFEKSVKDNSDVLLAKTHTMEEPSF